MPDQVSKDVSVEPHAAPGLKRLAAFILFSIICIILAMRTPLGQYFSVERISKVASDLGVLGPVILLLAGVVAPLLFIPRWPIAFVAGILYGVMGGSLIANVASTLGAWLHFTLAKSFLAPASRRLLRKYGVADSPFPSEKTFLALFFLRAFPLSNFVATNLLAGALKIPLRTYLAATFLGMVPSTLMYASWGKLMKKPSPWYYVLAIGILVIIVIGTIIAQRHIQPWFKRKNGNGVAEVVP